MHWAQTLPRVRRAPLARSDAPHRPVPNPSPPPPISAPQSQFVGGHIATRVKRWARCLERCTGGGTQEGLADGRCSASWQEVLRRYCLLSRSAHPVTDVRRPRGGGGGGAGRGKGGQGRVCKAQSGAGRVRRDSGAPANSHGCRAPGDPDRPASGLSQPNPPAHPPPKPQKRQTPKRPVSTANPNPRLFVSLPPPNRNPKPKPPNPAPTPTPPTPLPPSLCWLTSAGPCWTMI